MSVEQDLAREKIDMIEAMAGGLYETGNGRPSNATCFYLFCLQMFHRDNVKTDYVHWNGIGVVRFAESANDPAVVISAPIRMKGPWDQVAMALVQISEIVGNVGC